ncbi:hypothetical protein [Peptostreptococcus russellii]|uniref:hypothetical protein n=1 Tax=Peptostreptococcus russellii TaxID=215200 RepID=UPI003F589E51
MSDEDTNNSSDFNENYELTTEKLMAGAFKRNISYEAFKELSIFLIIDYIHEYNQLFVYDDQKELIATQNDFDKF